MFFPVLLDYSCIWDVDKCRVQLFSQFGCLVWMWLAEDVLTFNAAIGACEKASLWRKALDLFDQAPQVVVFNM